MDIKHREVKGEKGEANKTQRSTTFESGMAEMSVCFLFNYMVPWNRRGVGNGS